jgi:hypothetical protein
MKPHVRKREAAGATSLLADVLIAWFPFAILRLIPTRGLIITSASHLTNAYLSGCILWVDVRQEGKQSSLQLATSHVHSASYNTGHSA